MQNYNSRNKYYTKIEVQLVQVIIGNLIYCFNFRRKNTKITGIIGNSMQEKLIYYIAHAYSILYNEYRCYIK